jgi:hypothetical protein
VEDRRQAGALPAITHEIVQALHVVIYNFYERVFSNSPD